jgi:quercetin dioxygenase-like cupin family protein
LIEKVYDFSVIDQKVIERIVDDEYANLNHVILAKEDRLPEHFSNSNVYLLIVRGTMSIQLNQDHEQMYPNGKIINVPFNTKMNIRNVKEDILEFFIVKAPHPKDMVS